MTAIYVRQSLLKLDSLSIDGQIEICKKHTDDTEIKIYRDAGYSGKNTERPAFREMLADIDSGQINRVICYRLDRISRSVTDFDAMCKYFEEHKVELISATEQFDTSSPIGKAMRYIAMVFAQMERETTAQRITDNYYRRVRQGAWPGGPAPYGFDRVRQKIDGKMQTVLLPNAQLENIIWMFERYATGTATLGSIVSEMRKRTPDKTWSNVSVRRCLINPIYAVADADLYAYYNSLGAQIQNELNEFDGSFSAMLIGYRHAETRKRRPITEQKLYLMPTEGVIPSDVFIRVQQCLSENKQIKNSQKSQWSWLSGLMKCGECGYSIVLHHDPKVSTTKAYLCCSNRYGSVKTCTLRHSERIEDVETYVEQQIYDCMQQDRAKQSESDAAPEQRRELNDLKLKLLDIRQKQKNIVEAITVGGASAMRLLKPELDHLDADEQQVSAKISELSGKSRRWIPNLHISFDTLDLEGKRIIAASLIDKVIISPTEIKINWK